MSAPEAWADDWSVALRIWIERAGERFLDTERYELLCGIDACHSISAAARNLGISYRHAWALVQGVNAGAQTPIVVSVTGGPRGGGAELTALGQSAIALYGRIREHLRREASQVLSRLITPIDSPIFHVAAAVSLQDILNELLTQYTLDHPKARVRTLFGSSDELAEQILGGAPIDLFLSADRFPIDRLLAADRLTTAEPRILARNGLAFIARKDATLTVERLRDLTRVDETRLAIADAACPLGRYSRALLAKQGLLDRLADRLLVVEHSGAVVSSVRSGQAEIGLIYSSDVGRATDCRMLFRVERLPEPIVFSAAILRREHAAEADRLLDFLLSSTARRRWRANGFLPPAK